MSFRKDLNKVPAAACWDYEEIPLSLGERSEVGALESPLSMDARGRLWGLRRNPRGESEVGALES